jgi:hypothetical protein
MRRVRRPINRCSSGLLGTRQGVTPPCRPLGQPIGLPEQACSTGGKPKVHEGEVAERNDLADTFVGTVSTTTPCAW